jgi:hypothetical protein
MLPSSAYSCFLGYLEGEEASSQTPVPIYQTTWPRIPEYGSVYRRYEKHQTRVYHIWETFKICLGGNGNK